MLSGVCTGAWFLRGSATPGGGCFLLIGLALAGYDLPIVSQHVNMMMVVVVVMSVMILVVLWL